MTTEEFESRWTNRPPGARSRSSWPGDAIVLAGLCAVLAATVLAAATEMRGAGALLDVLTGLLAVATASLAATGRLSLALPLRGLAVPIALVALLALWIALQASPLLPASWHHPLWQLVAAALPAAAPSGAVSLDPGAGAESVIALLRDAVLFWVAYTLAATTRRSWQVLVALALFGSALSAWLLASRLIGLLGAGGAAAGSQQPAAWAGMAALALFCLAVARADEAVRHVPLPPSLTGQRPATPAWLAPTAAIACAAAALVTTPDRSLAGLVPGVLGFGIALLAAPSLSGLRRRSGFLWSIALLAVAILIAGWLAIHRLGAAVSALDAATLSPYGAAAQAMADAPLLGTGAGTIRAVLSLHGASGEDPGSYLQALVELGVPAALALGLACCGLAILCAEGIRHRHRNAVIPALGLAATLLLAGEAIAGRTLQDPLTALFWCTMMGVACAQSHTSRDRHGRG